MSFNNGNERRKLNAKWEHAILFLRGLAGLALLFSPSPSLH